MDPHTAHRFRERFISKDRNGWRADERSDLFLSSPGEFRLLDLARYQQAQESFCLVNHQHRPLVGLREGLDRLCHGKGMREQQQICGHGLLRSYLMHESISLACPQVDASSSQLERVNGLF